MEYPIGIMPRYIWIENRFEDITEAIQRYREAECPIPTEWLEELEILLKEMNSRRM